MTIRTEQTLRRMWEESAKLASDSSDLAIEAANAAVDAEAAERAAEAHRAAEVAARNVSNAMGDEAADLADMVNEKRQHAGLSPLAPGDPYPADPAPAEQRDDTLLVSQQSGTVTRTDGEVAGNV